MKHFALFILTALLVGCESGDITFGPAEDLGFGRGGSDYEGWETTGDRPPSDLAPSATNTSTTRSRSGYDRDRHSSGPNRHYYTGTAANTGAGYSVAQSDSAKRGSADKGGDDEPQWRYLDDEPAPASTQNQPLKSQTITVEATSNEPQWETLDSTLEEITVDETGAATVQ